jgi:cytoskeleton protein RodZ
VVEIVAPKARRMRRSTPKDQVDPAEIVMRELGARLRQARLERGEELDTVAQYLRIRPAYLAGIEDGDLSALPGRIYALGFLRSYADHLGLDGQDLVTQIKSAVGNLTRKQRLRIHTPMPESRLPKAPVLAISLALILAVYGAWSYVGNSGGQVVETVSEVPDDLRQIAIDALAPLPERTTPDEPQSRSGPAGGIGPVASAAPASDAPQDLALEPGAGQALDGAGGPAPDVSGVSDATPPHAAQAVTALPEAPASRAAQAQGSAPARVVLRALGTSWIHVSSTTGDYRYVRILEPGEALLLPDRPDLSLWTGNAGGLEIVVDGRALPPLGPDGRVIRNLQLDPESLLAHLQNRPR